jgi:hypothetical protein
MPKDFLELTVLEGSTKSRAISRHYISISVMNHIPRDSSLRNCYDDKGAGGRANLNL